MRLLLCHHPQLSSDWLATLEWSCEQKETDSKSFQTFEFS